MTAQLAPLAVQKFFDNNGFPLAFGQLTTYAAGTTTPQATYVDSTQTTPNTNPIQLNFRGECNLWLDPTKSYKFLLQDLFGNTIPGWPIDNIPGGFGALPISVSLIPSPTNTQTLGNASFSWANVYVGPNNAAVLDSVSGNIGYYARTAAETTALVIPTNYAYPPGNIRRYGAIVNGSTDDSAAIRKALDTAAQDGTTVTCIPPGQIKVGSTVYIPQQATNFGLRMSWYGCTFIGQGRGTGTIFESGTGTNSTGGATNFGQPNESPSSLHYKTIIEGAFFTACSAAIRWFNCIYGCELRDLRFENVSLPLYALRCFASRYFNCDAQVGGMTAGTYFFQFDSLNNAIVVEACSAQGNIADTTGIGFGFTGAGAGITFIGNTMEHVDTGLMLGAIEGMVNKGNYYEGITTRAIDAITTASNREMDVDNNWYLNCAKVLEAQLWIGGTFGAANHIQGTGGLVIINDNLSYCTVEIQQQLFTESTAATATAVTVPANYTLGNSVQLCARRFVYANASGPAAPLVIDTGNNMATPQFAYSGGSTANGAGYWLPFVTQTNVTSSSTLDTQILWSDYRMIVPFDLYGDIGGGGNIRLYGIVFSTGQILRGDSNTAAWTVTASNQSTKLRLTIGGTGLSGKTMLGWLGQIRHM